MAPAATTEDAIWAAPALALVPEAPGQAERFLPSVALSAIAPSPLNPRKDIGDLDELAASIRAHGVLQPPVVRPTPPALQQTTRGEGVIHPAFSLVAGERRWRAAQEAGAEAVPVLVRYDLDDDATVQKLMLVENLQRRDLNAIEEAEGYRRLRELGMRQTEIAQAVGRAQPTVANALRLLDLPDDVRERLCAGALTASHGRALAAYKDFPAVASRLAALAVEQGITSERLEKGALGEYAVQRELQRTGAVQVLEYGAPFDAAAVCRACPFGAFRSAIGTAVYGQGLCLKPEHYRELAKSAERERGAATRTALAQARAAGQTLPRLRDLAWDTVERLADRTAPAGCTGACPCRGQALDHDGQAVAICTDPKRFRALRAADTRAANADRRARRRAAVERLDARLDSLAAPAPGAPPTGPELAVVALLALQTVGRGADSTERLREAVARHGGAFVPNLEAARLADAHRWDGAAMRRALAVLSGLDATTVLRVVLAAVGRDDLETWERSPEVARWLGAVAEAEPARAGEPAPEIRETADAPPPAAASEPAP